MRIGIDVSILCNKFDGIGFYVLKVIERLNKNKDNIYYLYSNIQMTMRLNVGENFIFRPSNTPLHIKWLCTQLKKEIQSDKIDVFWQPNYLLPFKINGVKQIITVHDLSGYSFPEYVDIKTFIKQRLCLKLSCKYADVVLTDSKYSKEQIVETLKVSSEKIKVVYLSLVKSKIEDKELSNQVTKIITAQQDYFLFVGTFAPRKNDKLIINGFKRYIEQGGTKKLILAGKVSNKSQINLDNLDKKYDELLLQIGYINEAEKDALYKNAFCVIYPSRLEGFGIPILEAMSYGKLVITANNSSIPEVAGDAAIYLNDIDDDCEFTEILWKSEKLSCEEYDFFVSKGNKRVELFEQYNFPQLITKILCS